VLRDKVSAAGLVAFVANGSHLPRISGNSDVPLPFDQSIQFASAPSFERSFKVPNRTEEIKGMGIPAGVTLIVGGGFHGKSTLLRALEYGVYNHVPGDGREFVVSHPQTLKVKAEDGRYIAGVDISPFIR